MKKEDLRITKTKRDLRVALLELLKTNQFEKLTVGDICDKAMVNRMTFYKHFCDKYNLLESTINYLIEMMVEKASQFIQSINTFDEFVKFCCMFTRTIIEESASQKDLFPALYRTGKGIVYEVLAKTMRKYIFYIVSQFGKIKKLKYSLENTVEFLTGGIMHLFCHWLMNINKIDTKQFADECCDFTEQLIKSGLFIEK